MKLKSHSSFCKVLEFCYWDLPHLQLFMLINRFVRVMNPFMNVNVEICLDSLSTIGIQIVKE